MAFRSTDLCGILKITNERDLLSPSGEGLFLPYRPHSSSSLVLYDSVNKMKNIQQDIVSLCNFKGEHTDSHKTKVSLPKVLVLALFILISKWV